MVHNLATILNNNHGYTKYHNCLTDNQAEVFLLYNKRNVYFLFTIKLYSRSVQVILFCLQFTVTILHLARSLHVT